MAIRANVEITDTDMGMNDILAAFGVSEITTTVGIFGDAANDPKMVPEGPTDEPLGQVAIDLEFGLDKKNLPSRPFMRQTFDQNVNKYIQHICQTVNKVISEKNSAALNSRMKALGKISVLDIRTSLMRGVKPDLSKVSLIRKTQRPARNVTTPLIWIGQLFESLAFKVEAK